MNCPDNWPTELPSAKEQRDLAKNDNRLLLILMGNKQERRPPRPFFISQWQFVQCHNGYSLFRNAITAQHCEQYLLKVTSEADKLVYQRRKSKHQEHLVNILHCQVFTNFDDRYVLMDFTIRVFLERIPVRLQEIAQLPIDAIPLLVFECLLGFKKILEDYQPVRISDQMIGFNQNKELRVWLSRNFLENAPEATSTAANEHSMVSDIFAIFDQYSDLYLNRPELATFTQALQYIAQIKSVNRSQLTLIKVPNESGRPLMTQSELSLKYKQSIGPRNKNQYSPQPRRLPNKMLDVTISSRQRFDTEEAEDYKIVVQAVEPLKEQAAGSMVFTPALSNQRIHQRQVSTAISQPQPQQGSLFAKTADSDSRKNLTMVGPTKSVNQKSGVLIGIESARTTSNIMPLYDNFIELDNKGLQLELLDDKKSKQVKLNMIENVLIDHKDDENVRKVCKVYNYAIKFDPLMYHELQKAKGRISKISNQYVLRKLIQISEQQEEQDGSGSPTHSEPHIPPSWSKVNSINTNYSNDVVGSPPDMNLSKNQSEERIRRILVRERIKRGEDPDMKKNNRTFFGAPEPKQPRKTAMEMSYATFAKPRASDVSIPVQAFPRKDSERPLPPKKPEEEKKTDKREMMETFKKQFDRLFEF